MPPDFGQNMRWSERAKLPVEANPIGEKENYTKDQGECWHPLSARA
jgi:hypothetical protein